MLKLDTPLSAVESDAEKRKLCSVEDMSSSLQQPFLTSSTTYGRPDIEKIIKDAMDGMSPRSKVLVAVCGPSSFQQAARLATRHGRSASSPQIKLHMEKFGW